MKTFCYTSRDHSGALKKGTLQAIDRADALRQIKSMDCVPVSVTESSGVASGAHVSWNPTWNRRAVWLATAAVLLIAALVVWRSVAKRHEPPAAALGTPPQSVRPSQPANQAVKSARAVPKPKPAVSAAETPPQDVPQTAEAAEMLPTPASGVSPAVQAEALKPPQPPKPPNPYKTQTEQVLAMALSVPPGASIPPLPLSPNLNADFAKSLTNKIAIYDEDDDRTINTKENVAVAKGQLLELVKNGQNVSDVLKELQDKTNERAELRSQAKRKLADLYKNGSPEEAQAYLETVNKTFKEQGIEPISPPFSQKTK